MKRFSPYPVIVACCALVAAGSPGFGRSAAVAARASLAVATPVALATETPIPPPTDEPAAPAAGAPTFIPLPVYSTTPKPKSTPRPHPRKATPVPSPTPAPVPVATPSPGPVTTPTPAATASPAPAPRKAKPLAHPLDLGGYEPIAAYRAQSPVSKAVNAAIPELSRVAWMKGTWNCKISVHDNLQSAPHFSDMTTFVYDFTMNKRWLFGADGKGIEQHEITFDPLAKRWVFVRLGSDPAYAQATAANWSGDQIRFEDAVEFVDGREVHRRWTLAKLTNSHFTITDEEQTPTGDWLLQDEYDFTKAAT